MVVRRSSSALSSTAANRLDLICPGGTAYDFWLALQFANARAAGLRDNVCLNFEGGSINFPSDIPDSVAGNSYHELETAALQVDIGYQITNHLFHQFEYSNW